MASGVSSMIRVHAGRGLQSADVAAFAADDAALHFVAGQRHHTDGGLAAVVGSAAAADVLTDQVAWNVVAVFLQVGLIGGNAHSLSWVSSSSTLCSSTSRASS